MRHHLILRVVTKMLVGTIILFAFYVQFHGDFGPGQSLIFGQALG